MIAAPESKKSISPLLISPKLSSWQNPLLLGSLAFIVGYSLSSDQWKKLQYPTQKLGVDLLNLIMGTLAHRIQAEVTQAFSELSKVASTEFHSP
jgi:hypothetical protein